MNPFDPQQLLGQADPAQLIAAAAKFPGGAAALAFALFFAPAGLPIAYLFAGLVPGIPATIFLAGIPAAVVLARLAGVNPAVTFALYALSDVLGALFCQPLYRALRRLAGRVPLLARFGRGLLKVAMFGARIPRAEDIHRTGRIAPALFRIGTVGFGIDVYTAGMLVAGLPVPRIAGWSAAIAGDMVWFAILLVTSILTAAVVDDYRIQIVVVLVAMFAVQFFAKRLFPALRDDPPPKAVVPTAAGSALEEPALPAPPIGVPAGSSNGPAASRRQTVVSEEAPSRRRDPPVPDRASRPAGGPAPTAGRARARTRKGRSRHGRSAL